MKLSGHLATGAAGEDAALRHLAARGFRLISRNWRPRNGTGKLELDLVGERDSELVFVEVKTRTGRGNATPDELDGPDGPKAFRNFTPAKRGNMIRAATAYLAEHGLWAKPCRFDLVCVTFFPGKPPQVDHYRDVIELGHSLDRGNASWQPW